MILSLRKMRAVKLALIALLLLCNGVPSHSSEVSQEYQLKAAFLFNFARFITWPENALPEESKTINFCIIGENPFGTILSNIESKIISGHSVKIYYLDTRSNPQQCHLAFFGKGTGGEPQDIEWKFTSETTLTVSDMKDFINIGGDIEFIRKKNRIKFVINNSRLKRKGLTPRASLLELAAEIR